MSRSYKAKLQLGRERLEHAGDSEDRLGGVLVAVHGALEVYLRTALYHSPNLSRAEKEVIWSMRVTHWRQILELADAYALLSPREIALVKDMNYHRICFAHGDRLQASRSIVEAYTRFVEGIITTNRGMPEAERRVAEAALTMPPDEYAGYIWEVEWIEAMELRGWRRVVNYTDPGDWVRFAPPDDADA